MTILYTFPEIFKFFKTFLEMIENKMDWIHFGLVVEEERNTI